MKTDNNTPNSAVAAKRKMEAMENENPYTCKTVESFEKKSTNRAAHSTRFIHIIGRLKCSWIEHLEFLIAYFAYEIEKH